MSTKKQKILPESWQEQLMLEVREFQAVSGMKFTTIGAKGMKNARMWERLETGGTITLRQADRLRTWMAEQEIPPQP